jgi:hypothetical protein
MKRLAVYATMMIVVFFVCGMVNPSWAGIKADIDEQANLEVGIWQPRGRHLGAGLVSVG